MGRYVNPDNSAFQVSLNSEIYVDKTGLIEYTNRILGSPQAYICNSRPRRFGKSVTANMLAAYYSVGCNSREMFQGLQVSKSKEYEKHLNRYDVIHFDVQWMAIQAENLDTCVPFMEEAIVHELQEEFPEIVRNRMRLSMALAEIYGETSRKFIIIIDEWDVLVRDQEVSKKNREEYLDFLESIFRGLEPSKYIQLAYMTGILPVRKVVNRPMLGNFTDFSMTNPKVLAPYFGFTDEEVQALCQQYGQDFSLVRQWYDGYLLKGHHLYNPVSVVNAMLWGKCSSYWYATGSFEAIRPLLNREFPELRKEIVSMLSGDRVKADPILLQNGVEYVEIKKDILDMLVHLGYLAYDEQKSEVFVPNKEIRRELTDAIRNAGWKELENEEQGDIDEEDNSDRTGKSSVRLEGIYFFQGKDITVNVCIQIRDVVGLISRKEEIPFPDAAYLFYSSDTYRVLRDTENGFWAESAEYIVDRYYEEKEKMKCS